MKAVRLYLALAATILVLSALTPLLARAEGDETPNLELRVADEANLGDMVIAEARLTTVSGQPIEGAKVVFFSEAVWSAEFQGEMEIGDAITDSKGVARITYEMRRSGQIPIIARFEGNARFREAEAESALEVAGDTQLYLPRVGISVPGLGWWLIAMVLAGVWGLYFLTGAKVLAIARSAAAAVPPAVAAASRGLPRRQLLNQLVPLGMLGVIGGLGSGLIAIVARAPYTHGHLERKPLKSGYRRTPMVFVGGEMGMKEMPAALEREVSFSQEVMPIFRAKGGPHVYLPANSPVPGGIRLDEYEHVMEKEDLVVPGKPERSALVGVLLDRSMGMPPAGELLSDSEVQLVVSWVAQGAKNN